MHFSIYETFDKRRPLQFNTMAYDSLVIYRAAIHVGKPVTNGLELNLESIAVVRSVIACITNHAHVNDVPLPPSPTYRAQVALPLGIVMIIRRRCGRFT
jgi:hypothetical protein